MKVFLVVFGGTRQLKRTTYRSTEDVKARFFSDLIDLVGKEWTEIHLSVLKDGCRELLRSRNEKKTKKG